MVWLLRYVLLVLIILFSNTGKLLFTPKQKIELQETKTFLSR